MVGDTTGTASSWMAMVTTVVGNGSTAETVDGHRAGERGDSEIGVRI